MSKGEAQQRSKQWFRERLGRFTASTFNDCLGTGKIKDSRFTLTGQSLIREKVTERLTGKSKKIKGEALDWGTEHEDMAIIAYEELTGESVVTAPFVKLKGFEKWAGGSPDGFIENKNGIIEVKCPFVSSNHVEALIEGKIPSKAYKKYYTQIQFNILVTEADFCDFISFDPRMKKELDKICVIRIERDDEYIEKIIERLNISIKELKWYLEVISRGAKTKAL